MGVYLFMIGAYDLKFRGEYNRHAQAWMDSAACQVVGSLAMLSTEVSVLLLTYLTLEKYISIVYPFRYLTPGRRRTVTILVAIWVLGFIIALTSGFHTESSKSRSMEPSLDMLLLLLLRPALRLGSQW